MATITYQCSVCDRRIDLVENRQGLTAFGKCIITNGCRGKLNKIKRNIDNIREEFPPEVSGLTDYIQRKALYNFTQHLPSNTWIIKHGLSTNPAINVYVYDDAQKLTIATPDSYVANFIDKDTLQVSFKSSLTGVVQVVSRTSVKIKPKTLTPTIDPFQVTSNGIFVFAIPKYLTKFDYPPSLLPPPSIPYDLANAPIRIEVSIQRPNTEEEICTEYLDSSLFGTPWADWNEVLIRKRRNHYLFTKNILEFRTFGGDDLKLNDIPYGTQLKITRIDYGTGVLQTIPSEGLCIMLATDPYTSNDKIKNKLVNVSDMVKNDIDYFSFTGNEFVVDVSNVTKTYPEITKVVVKPYIPPTPSPTVSASTTPMISVTPTITPTISVTPTQGSFNQSFDYAVIRYTWNSSDGTDLDTRTAIINPPRNVDVGWHRNGADGEYLTWGGDNTSPDGPEAVLVNFNKLSTDYPDLTDFNVRLRTFWYNTKVDGNIGVQFQTYSGGTMQHTGTDFTNIGGSLVNDTVIYVNSPTNQSSDVDGDDIGTLTYDNVTKTGSFVLSIPAVTPTPTPSITPTISITPSITPTISITPSITPSMVVDNVVTYLRMNGADNSTTFTDEKGKTYTKNGNAKIQNNMLYVDGADSYLSTPGSTDFVFGTGDFTVEFFMQTSQTGERYIIDYYNNIQGQTLGTWQIGMKNNVPIFLRPGGVSLSGTTVVNNNSLHHIAVVRESGTLKIFVDGLLNASMQDTTDYSYQTDYLGIGAQVTMRNAAYDFAGYIDDVRITKGLARYTGDFAPPSNLV